MDGRPLSVQQAIGITDVARVIKNVVLFQLGWFACVFGGSGQWHWLASLFVILVLIHHLFDASSVSTELQLLLCAGLIGFVWDSILVRLGILQFEFGFLHENFAPEWIVAMWLLFATTLNVSLRWLKKRWLISAVFGAVGGPLAYLAGQKLGAVVMPDLWVGLAVLCVGWSFIFPLLVWLSLHFDGFSDHTHTGTES